MNDNLKPSSTIRTFKFLPVLLILFFSLSAGRAQNSQGSLIEYTVSMENPNNHYFHISLNYSGFGEKSVLLKMPVWTPGYYMIMDYPKNLINFSVTGLSGNKLVWKKTSKNCWEINTEGEILIRVTYDIFAFRTSVADSFLDDGRGFISPTGIFMYPEGKKDHPVTVSIIPYEKFSEISTGLDPVPGRKNTFYATGFDVLYDCPVLAGNQEIIRFETGGIPYTIAAENLGKVERPKLIEDYRKIVETSTSLIGEIPYKHYTFIMMNKGMGGLEHTNSMAVFSNRLDIGSSELSGGWLSFIAHEFFHLYNVKTIRPIALGPFDYDRENYTDMLWFSEGVTSYYENLILNRAGLFKREDVFRELKTSISNYENIPGHHFQSVAESGFDSWMLFFNRSENASNTTISYYDKGCALGMLLDLRIRYESGDKKSLDDVMRTLYKVYYKGLNRGFTNVEFREVCEKAAGASLAEIFDVYIPTTNEIDYSKYLAYAGLSIDTGFVETPGAWLGIETRQEGENLIITKSEWNSPGYNAGLSPHDLIKEIDGEKATAVVLATTLGAKNPGDKVRLTISHRDMTNDVEVSLGKKTARSFEITPFSNPTPEQSAILDKWLK